MSSGIWEHCQKIPGGRVCCLECNKTYAYHNSTSTLAKHLRVQHGIDTSSRRSSNPSAPPQKRRRVCYDESPDEPDPLPDPNSLASTQVDPSTESEVSTPRLNPPTLSFTPRRNGSIRGWVQESASFKDGGQKKKDVNNALIYMIAKDNLPLDTAEKRGFRKFCKTVNPMYKPPCEVTTTKMIEEKYVHLRGKVGQQLDAADSITLTMDLWSEHKTNRGFLGITAHHPEGPELKNIALGARQVDERKTIANLKLRIEEVCVAWQIDKSKVIAVVTDGGPNIIGAVREFFGPKVNVYCVAHQINNVAQAAIGLYKKEVVATEPECDELETDDIPDDVAAPGRNELRAVIVKVKKIVAFFRQSDVAATELKNFQKNEWGKKEGQCLRLIQEVRTRWNSMYQMLHRYIDLSDFIPRILLKLAKEKSSKCKVPEILTASEYDTITEVCRVLKPLYQITLEACAERHVTISKVIPLINLLKTKMTKCDTFDPIAFNLKSRLLDEINKQFFDKKKVEFHTISGIATVLDPRYKTMHFDDKRALASACSNIQTLMMELANQEVHEPPSEEAEVLTDLNEDDDNIWALHDKLLNDQKQQATRTSAERDDIGYPVELKQYLRTPPSSRSVNPLLEWERLKSDYPTLYKIAMKYLGILATSVPCERLFSSAGNILRKARNRLSGMHMDQLLFLSHVDEALWFESL